jgi:hypothetical protein
MFIQILLAVISAKEFSWVCIVQHTGMCERKQKLIDSNQNKKQKENENANKNKVFT